MDIKGFRWILSTYMIVIGITGFFITGCESIPHFEGLPPFMQVYENISIGTQLFMMNATDTDPNNVMTFNATDTDTNIYVNIIQFSYLSVAKANVTVKTPFYRESHEGGIALTFSVIDSRGHTVNRNVRLYLLDVCDEFPHFDKPSYTFYIHENYMNGTKAPLQVYSEIQATDKDAGFNAVVFYYMEPKTESSYWWEKYNQTFSIDSQSGNIYLLQDLDYEENSFYEFTLHARDRCNLTAESADLHIIVRDVQDTPPFFVGMPYMRNIMEGTLDNTVLLRVRALDGDRGIPNAISYFLSTSSKICHDHFVINESTGEIVIRGALDWGMNELWLIHGVCIFIVEAREIDKYPGNQRGKTVSSTTVIVTILRSNFHASNLQSCVYNPMNCSCICTEHQNVGPNNIVG